MRGNPVFLRVALLLVAAAVVPACGSSGGSALMGGGTVLLSDAFGTYPDAAVWTANGGGGTDAQDLVNGAPAPSLSMTGATAGQDPSIRSVSTFATPSLTVSVAMAASGTPPLKGSGIILVNDAGNALAATASWDAQTGNITFTIDADTVTVPAPAADGAFTTMVYKLSAAGIGTWTMGGTLQLTGLTAWPAGTVTVGLSVDMVGGGNNPATFKFDNVAVTTP